MSDQLKKILFFSGIIAAAFAGILVAIGFAHNAQGEFHSVEEGIDLSYALSLFSTWFVLIFLLLAVVGLIGRLILFKVIVRRDDS